MIAFVWAGTALAITAILAAVGLPAWRGWLDLRRFEFPQQQEARREELDPSPAIRTEMADLKERLKKLEAIATGVDL